MLCYYIYIYIGWKLWKQNEKKKAEKLKQEKKLMKAQRRNKRSATKNPISFKQQSTSNKATKRGLDVTDEIRKEEEIASPSKKRKLNNNEQESSNHNNSNR